MNNLTHNTLTANGYEFAYVEAGDGDPVVFIHGSLMDYRYWAREITYFSQHYRTIAMSRRHHWPAVVDGPFVYKMQAQVDDVIAFLEQLDAGPVHLVGHSYAGYIATRIACIKPELLSSLSLVEPGGPIEGQVTGLSPREDLIQAADMVMNGQYSEGVAHFMDAVCAENQWINGAENYRLMTLSNAITITEQVKEVRDPILVTELSQIRVPVLLIMGSLTGSPFPEMIDQLFDSLPRCEKVVIPDASHLVNVDNHVAFSQALEKFLAAHQH